MSVDFHSQIANFIRKLGTPVAIPRPDRIGLLPANYTKAGVVPFHRSGSQLQYYLMKPQASHPHLPPPEFQLCKGTRMRQDQAQVWADMRDGEVADENSETLLQTALREGMEEVGLRLENIRQLYALGGFHFASASTGKDKQVWLFAVQVEDREDFLATEATTAERAWLSIEEFTAHGRPDHRYILSDIDYWLKKEYTHSSR